MNMLDEIIQELRRPFMPAAVSFKIQTNPKQRDGGGMSKALIVGYMDNRIAVERLNVVCAGDWQDEFGDPFPIGAGYGLKCRLTVCDVQREDAAWETNARLDTGASGDMALKGLYSNAFKRAATKYGIGVSLYAMPKIFLDATDLKSSGNSYYLTRDTEANLRQRYATWCQQAAILRRFGEPFDHGDDPDAQGDAVDAHSQDHPEQEPVASQPAPAPAQEAPAAAPPQAQAATDGPDALQQLRVAYADSQCTQAVWTAKLTEMGLSSPGEATPEQVEHLMSWLAGS